MITDPFANNPPKFDFSGGRVTQISGEFAPRINVQPVEESRRAAKLPDAIDAGTQYPDFAPTGSPPPFPAAGDMQQPGIPGTVGLPIRIVSR